MMRKILLFTVFIVSCIASITGATQKEIKSFNEVITKEFNTKKGLFTVYQSADRLYIGIPDSLLQRKMLLACRIAEVSDPSKAFAGEMRRKPLEFSFSLHGTDIFMLTTDNNISVGETNSNLNISFARNFILPVYKVFPISCYDSDSNYVIDVTKFFSEEIDAITPFSSKGKPGKFDPESSFIDKVQVFSSNIEIQSYFNYMGTTSPFRAKLNRSVLILPENKMMPRFYNERMSFYDTGKRTLNEDGEFVKSNSSISRFRLEPKSHEKEKFFAGEKVEPLKPIIFYVDNGFPEKWRNYIKQGIEDWQPAFEAIGFKKAIIAKDYPDDPEFNPDDLRYNCFRYVTTIVANAQGTRWVDPRTGEILSADVYWFHNVLQKLHDWRFVQCAAADEASRKKVFDEKLLGRLIRYAAAHEIGHCLGMEHNMRASYAFSVDSLRSPYFTAKYGTTPSIMDYARNNYIAQPGDGVTEFAPPLLGIYDMFAVKTGYSIIEGVVNPEEEYPTINRWFVEAAKNPQLRFVKQFALGISPDPSAQAEALGDDAIKAGYLGTKNAKYIADHLIEWCTNPGDEYGYLSDIYNELTKQYFRYLEHTTSYIGGAYEYYGVEGESIPRYTWISKEKQLEAADWVLNQLTENDWLESAPLKSRIKNIKDERIKDNTKALDNLMNGYIFQRIKTSESELTVSDYLKHLGDKIWAMGNKGRNLSEMEIILQQSYVQNLISISKTSIREASDIIGDSSEDNLASALSTKINYVEYYVAMAAKEELQRAKEVAKKYRKRNPAHYNFLLGIL